MSKKIASVRGWWSTNIGNSLFQISAQGLLEELGHQVFLTPDAPAYANVKKGNPKNYFDFNPNLDIDCLCIHGPFFRKEFDKIYLETLSNLSKRGVKVIGLGVGCMHYDKGLIKYYRDWAQAAGIETIATRDERTYDFLKGSIKNLYNGIDLGFLISFYAPQPKFIDNRSFVCFNFDQIPEPIFFEDNNGPVTIGDKKYNYKKSYSREPKGILKKVFPFIRPYFKKFERTEIGEQTIIRTDHRFNPYSRKKIYTDNNTFAMDTPDGYLLAYANSYLTLSNRVHANVATLSYGNSAMYFSDSKRALLLDRMGVADIYNKPLKVEREKLEEEKSALLAFIANSI